MIQTIFHKIQTELFSLVCEARNPKPVLITVPHDGLQVNALSDIFKPRYSGYHMRDVNVWPIAKDILVSTGVNGIRGLMPRAFVDYNRAWPEGINYYPLTQKEVHTALDDERLLPAYVYYHSSIDRIIETSVAVFGREKVILIDLHGFKKQPPYAPDDGYDIILGTGNRVSIPHGDIDVRFAKFMEVCGYKVFLPTTELLGPIEDWYSADYTTRHHSKKHNINVIQIEIASRFRVGESFELGKKLAADFAKFIHTSCL